MDDRCEEIVIRRSGSFSTLMKGLLLGGLVGAGVALLSTPRTGEENKAYLREKSAVIKEKAMQQIDETRLRAEEITRQGTQRASELKDRGQSILEKEKAVVQSAVEGLKEGIRTYKESGQSGTSAVEPHTALAPTGETAIQPAAHARSFPAE